MDLAAIPRLRRLSISRAPALTSAVFDVLRRCTSLRELFLPLETFGRDAIDALARDRPGVEVDSLG